MAGSFKVEYTIDAESKQGGIHLQLYMTAAPDQYRPLAGLGFRLCHLAYQIGPDNHLHRSIVSRQTQNGLMAISDTAPPPIQDSAQLCREILRECTNRGFDGVHADFGTVTTPDRIAFLEQLSPLLHRNSKKLFVSSAYGRHVPSAYVLINTALSGGTLRAMLSDAAYTFGRQRIAMDIERLRMDFLLPSPSGEGTALSQGTFEALYQECAPSVFFSHELCAKYFTYQKEGRTHFVLFDDADTIRFKLKLGTALELRYAFLLYSEVSDLAASLR